MKKIPTLFKRVFSPDHKTKTILPEVTPGCEAVLEGRCVPTVKWDGACCAIINGEIYKRYDAKVGKNGKQKQPPEGAIPCQPEPDPITGHWPHWVECDPANPADKYFLEAYHNAWLARERKGGLRGQMITPLRDGTYEAIGPAWQGNSYHLAKNTLVAHGNDECGDLAELIEEQLSYGRVIGASKLPTDVMYDLLEKYLCENEIEGIVFWHNGSPMCKIKRSDFGFPWPVKP